MAAIAVIFFKVYKRNFVSEVLDSVKVTAYVKGNWEDSFLDVLNKQIDFENATDIYVSRLVRYQC